MEKRRVLPEEHEYQHRWMASSYMGAQVERCSYVRCGIIRSFDGSDHSICIGALHGSFDRKAANVNST